MRDTGIKSTNGQVEVTDQDQGRVRVVFATFNTVDRDGDVTLPGAFQIGQKAAISAYGHGTTIHGTEPVGVGVIGADDREAWLDGEFFLDTPDGANAFKKVKRMSAEGIQEWSYGYNILDGDRGIHDGEPVRFLKSMDVTEVSPVLRGAGIGTRTVMVKHEGTFTSHADAVRDAVKDLVERSEALAALRASDGRRISQANLDRLQAVATDTKGLVSALEALVAADAGEAAQDPRTVGASLFARAVRHGHINMRGAR